MHTGHEDEVANLSEQKCPVVGSMDMRHYIEESPNNWTLRWLIYQSRKLYACQFLFCCTPHGSNRTTKWIQLKRRQMQTLKYLKFKTLSGDSLLSLSCFCDRRIDTELHYTHPFDKLIACPSVIPMFFCVCHNKPPSCMVKSASCRIVI